MPDEACGCFFGGVRVHLSGGDRAATEAPRYRGGLSHAAVLRSFLPTRSGSGSALTQSGAVWRSRLSRLAARDTRSSAPFVAGETGVARLARLVGASGSGRAQWHGVCFMQLSGARERCLAV